MYIPAELVYVKDGQRQHTLNGDVVAKIIKEAAVKPDERFHKICGPIGSEPPLIALISNNDNAMVT